MTIVRNGGHNLPDYVPTEGGDHKVAVDSSDTAPGFLHGKLKAGEHIAITTVVDGGTRKEQIDADWPTVPVASDEMPSADGGTGTAGASPDFSRADHAHPSPDPVTEGAYLYPALVSNPLLRTAVRGLIASGGEIWTFGTTAVQISGVSTWQESVTPGPLYLKDNSGSGTIRARDGDRVLGVVDGGTSTHAGIYEVVDCGIHTPSGGEWPGSGPAVTTKAVIRRATDANTPAGLCHGMVVQVTGGASFQYNGDWFTLSTADPIVVDTTPIAFSHSGTAPAGDQHELLTGAQLTTEGASSADADTVATASAGGDGYLLAFETLAGTPGASAIPAAPWTFEHEAIWLDADLGGETVLRWEVYKDVGGVPALLFTAESPPIHNTTPAPLAYQFDGAPYAISPTDRLNAIGVVHTTSVTPVTLHLRYNSATRGTRIKTPFTFATPGTLDHQLLVDRDPDVGAGASAAHPANSIGAGRLHRNIGTGSLAGGIITFPADANFCRVSGVLTINGINATGFPMDGTPVAFFVADASPSNRVVIKHKASVSAPALPFWLEPLSGQTAGQQVTLAAPSTVDAWLDLANSCVRLRCRPFGSVNT